MLGWAESRDNLVAKELWSKGGQMVTALAWPEFEYWRQQFVVDFRPCTEKIFSGCLGFPFLSEMNISKFQFDSDGWTKDHLVGEPPVNCYLFIHSFIHLVVCLLIYFSIQYSVFSLVYRLCQCAAKSAPRDLLAINSCSYRLLFRFCIVADEEPVATTSMPTSTGAKSIGTNLRAENQGPAVGSPQTPPTLNVPSTRYVRCKE